MEAPAPDVNEVNSIAETRLSLLADVFEGAEGSKETVNKHKKN